jgi:hypothetical protein
MNKDYILQNWKEKIEHNDLLYQISEDFDRKCLKELSIIQKISIMLKNLKEA